MGVYKLTISPNYVPDWSVVDAVREIFQNALDQERKNSANAMSRAYDPKDSKLYICSKESTLQHKSLLLGEGEKADDEEAIGEFGEGYKLALLVLTRFGHNVRIINYGLREVWTPELSFDKKFGAVVLKVKTRKSSVLKRPPNGDLTFEIGDISEAMYDRIVESNLNLQSLLSNEVVETRRGNILLSEKHKGRIYVDGLYISTREGFNYGYDIKPRYIDLARDRKLPGDFDLRWTTSGMWAEAKRKDLALELIKADAHEVEFVKNQGGSLSSLAVDDFRGKYGPMAYPVSSQVEYESIKTNYTNIRPVFVSGTQNELLGEVRNFVLNSAKVAVVRKEPVEIIQEFINKFIYSLSDSALEAIETIERQSKNWTIK